MEVVVVLFEEVLLLGFIYCFSWLSLDAHTTPGVLIFHMC